MADARSMFRDIPQQLQAEVGLPHAPVVGTHKRAPSMLSADIVPNTVSPPVAVDSAVRISPDPSQDIRQDEVQESQSPLNASRVADATSDPWDLSTTKLIAIKEDGVRRQDQNPGSDDAASKIDPTMPSQSSSVLGNWCTASGHRTVPMGRISLDEEDHATAIQPLLKQHSFEDGATSETSPVLRGYADWDLPPWAFPSSQGSPRVVTTTSAMEPSSYYRRHSRGHSGGERMKSIDETESMPDDSYEMVEPPSPTKARQLGTSASAATSMLRRLTTKFKPMSRAAFKSTKRSKNREYAALEGEDGGPGDAVDISSLEGMGWELTYLSHPDPIRFVDEETEYVRPAESAKSNFRKFVDKRTSVGYGMKNIGAQLRRDPTRIVRRGTGDMRGGNSSAIERSMTMKDFGQNLAQKKNMIVEVEGVVDFSTLEGGQSHNRMRQSVMPQETKSYFFPEDPDIPNWKPWSLRPIYILSLLTLALALAGFQEFLCQRSYQHVREKTGILAFNDADEISSWDWFAWKYLSTMVTIVYAVLFSIMDFNIRRLEPFYQLSRPRGASAAASLNLNYLTMSQYFVPFKAFRLRQWAVFYSTTGNIVASMVSPALQNPSITFTKNRDPICTPNGCPYANGEEKLYWVRISPVWSRLLSASYIFVAIVLVILFVQLRRKSGLLSDPRGIAGIASMATKSHILQDFSGLDTAHCDKIHKRLAHRRYLLYKSSIWQGEWSTVGERPQDSEKNLTSSHPPMLRTEAALPFLASMVVYLATIPIITLTKARVIPNAIPWLPILIATGLKLLFSTFESDVRLMEPFYRLSKGNAKPENSLTLDYQGIILVPLEALWNRHYLPALVGVASISLDVLTVTVSSLVNSEYFMHFSNYSEDGSSGDDTYVSLWASLVLSLLILVFVIFTTCLVYLRRRHPFLPREPSTIAAVLAFIYSSNMLTDFIGTERLNNEVMETRLRNIGKRYALGWFKGRDGQIHCAIDEEPVRSRYVHGKPYTMAQAGPLEPHDTFYAV
ncbi:hypothetical protein LTR20_007080 [Exophiala xenobiotica]|nr:hypothetical protein LTS06_011188 [Exophiala xenobiotica]KAK5380479.1 hypothetical protein LTS13_003337 [Exophiala xenobiotica]KAK5393147.1 hypothetical protein LTR79_009461 [Exophiala xenobiotica]KAK5412083.1 hypothetical protein LTR90_007645 [Exophiala xenobiotica]KAK5460654.1 hypothetical protein LTR20_007080 [Exophiala xenobiotica]